LKSWKGINHWIFIKFQQDYPSER